MARNQFEGACKDCGTHVAAGAGYFHKMPRGSVPKWRVRCMACVVEGKQARGDSLSDAQLAFIKSIPQPTRRPNDGPEA